MRRWPLLGNRDYLLFWSGQALSELRRARRPRRSQAADDRRRRHPDAWRGEHRRRAVARHPAYPQIVVVAFLDGGLFITSHICERGALPHLVAGDQIQDAVAQNEARYFSASIIGPPLGGVLFGATRALPFLVDAVSFVCSMTTTALTRPRFQATGERVTSVRAGMTDGFAWLRHQPFFLTTSLLFAAGNPVYTGLYLLAILLAKQDGASSGAVGAMFAIVGAGGVLGAVAAAPARRRLSARAVIVGEEWLLLGCVLLMLVARSAPVIGLLVAAAEFATPIGNSLVAGSRVAVTPDRLQGRVAAVSSTLSMSLAWLGPLAVGLLVQHAGSTTTVLVVAAWTLGIATVASVATAIRHGPPTAPPATRPRPDPNSSVEPAAAPSRSGIV